MGYALTKTIHGSLASSPEIGELETSGLWPSYGETSATNPDELVEDSAISRIVFKHELEVSSSPIGGTPIAGWWMMVFVNGKIPSFEMDDDLGVPLFFRKPPFSQSSIVSK